MVVGECRCSLTLKSAADKDESARSASTRGLSARGWVCWARADDGWAAAGGRARCAAPDARGPGAVRRRVGACAVGKAIDDMVVVRSRLSEVDERKQKTKRRGVLGLAQCFRAMAEAAGDGAAAAEAPMVVDLYDIGAMKSVLDDALREVRLTCGEEEERRERGAKEKSVQ